MWLEDIQKVMAGWLWGGVLERGGETESEREEEGKGGHEDRSLTLFCQLTPADLSGRYMWGV